jgi:hypothetical protein
MAEQQHDMTAAGLVTWHSSEEDGGPDVGLSLGLGDGAMLWVGEGSDSPLQIIHYGKNHYTVIGRCLDEDAGRTLIEALQAALNARPAPAEAAPGVEGWKLVPVEPTPEILDAFIDKALKADDFSYGLKIGDRAGGYRAMLSAAPTPPAAAQGWRSQALTDIAAERDAALAECKRLDALINHPEVEDFLSGVKLEAAHQQERWGVDHDAGKTPADWFWLLGYLGQKALHSAMSGDAEKAKHHTITTAAACLNWHAAITGRLTAMRPGIEAPTPPTPASQEGAEHG